MKALIPGLGALPWSSEQGSVSTGYELQDSLPSAWLQQPQTLVIEFSTPQQLANFFIAAAVVDNTTLTHADNGLARPYARVSSATTNARVISATTNPTQPGPEQAQYKHARVSGLICFCAQPSTEARDRAPARTDHRRRRRRMQRQRNHGCPAAPPRNHGCPRWRCQCRHVQLFAPPSDERD